jgi:hypothetical protein
MTTTSKYLGNAKTSSKNFSLLFSLPAPPSLTLRRFDSRRPASYNV